MNFGTPLLQCQVPTWLGKLEDAEPDLHVGQGLRQ